VGMRDGNTTDCRLGYADGCGVPGVCRHPTAGATLSPRA
jgi:hypothetical protein